jgi:peptidoglycan/xylan/chitin deacetylase (PgdA/CDA1 family)
MMRNALAALLAVLALVACGTPGSSGGGSSPAPASTVSSTCTRAFTREAHDGSAMAPKTLALTFDDGPSEFSTAFSAYLKEAGIEATFFINGQNVPGLEAALDEEIADGHLIGNHTQAHASLPSLSPDQIVDEVTETDAYLTRIPQDRLFFRPPYGDWGDAVAQALAGTPMDKYFGPVDWDIGGQLTQTTAADWDCWDEENGTRTVTQCGDLYLNEIRTVGHGIVLMHDGPPGGNGDKTLAMVKYLVPKLVAEGYTFQRIDQVYLGSATSTVSPGAPAASAGTTPAPPAPASRKEGPPPANAAPRGDGAGNAPASPCN